MANKGKRMLFEEDYNYVIDLKENHPDPSAEWGGGSGGDVNIEAGTGITITTESDDTKVISLDTTPSTFEVTASTGTTLEVTNANPLYKDAKLQMTSAGSTRVEGATIDIEANNIYLHSDTAPYYVNNTSHEYKTLATTDQLFSGNYNDLTNKPTIPDAVSGTNDGTNWTSLTIGEDTYGLASGGTTYTAGTGIDITNDTISVDNTVAMKTDIPDVSNMVTTNTTQEITGEKTFKGDKRIKFKGTANNSKLGFTGYDQNGVEVGYLEMCKQDNTLGTATSNVLGYYSDTTSSGPTPSKDPLLGFKYQTKDSTGTKRQLNLMVPTRATASSSTKYIPISVNGVTPNNTGDISLTIPTVNDPTITFTQGGVTKGTITLNQASNQTIALDAGSTPSNMVTTDTAQDITASKSFTGNANIYVQSGSTYTSSDTMITNSMVSASTIDGTTVSAGQLSLSDSTTAGHSQIRVRDFSQGVPFTDYTIEVPTKNGTMALTSDITNVSGTNDGTNWTSLTIGSDTYDIPQGGGSSSNTFDNSYLGDLLLEFNLTGVTANDYTYIGKLCDFSKNQGALLTNLTFWYYDSNNYLKQSYSSLVSATTNITYEGQTYKSSYHISIYADGNYYDVYLASLDQNPSTSYVDYDYDTVVFIKKQSSTGTPSIELNWQIRSIKVKDLITADSPISKNVSSFGNIRIFLNYNKDYLTLDDSAALSPYPKAIGAYSTSYTTYENTDYTISGNTMTFSNLEFQYAICNQLVASYLGNYQFSWKVGNTQSGSGTGNPTISNNTYTYSGNFTFSFTDNLDGTFTILTPLSWTIHITPQSTFAITNFTTAANLVSQIDKKFIPLVSEIPAAPSTAGTYTLQCTVDAQGNVTYNWV